MEDCFTVSGKALVSARGLARAAALGSVFFALLALLALLSLENIGSGFVVFSLIALYFIGLLWWQWRLYHILSRVVIMLDADGLLVSYGGREVMYGREELCLDQGCLPRAAGLGKRVRVCRAFLVCGRELFVDIESRPQADRTDAPVLRGRIIPLDAGEYARFLDSLGRYGWNRPCHIRAQDGAPAYPLRLTRALYLGTGLLASLAYILLDDPRLSLVFLLIGLACAGLFLNTLYVRARSSSQRE